MSLLTVRNLGKSFGAVVAARDVVNSIYESAQKSGLSPRYLETESSALLSCVRSLRTPSPNRIAIIDLGSSSFRLIFLHGGRVSMTRSLYFGLASLVGGAEATTGSSAMPHFGHVPGPVCRISWSIGQVYSTSRGAASSAVWRRAGSTNRAGSALNCSRQWGLQK